MVLHVLTTFVIYLAVKIAGQTLNKTTDLIQVSLSLSLSLLLFPPSPCGIKPM